MSSFRLCPVSAGSGRKEIIETTIRRTMLSGGRSPFRGHGGALNAPENIIAFRFLPARLSGCGARLPGVVSRTLLVFAAAVALSAAATPPSCIGSLPVGSVRLMVEPEKGGPARSLRLLNNLKAGAKVRYEPLRIPDAVKQKAHVALLLISPAQELAVLDSRPAAKACEWRLPA